MINLRSDTVTRPTPEMYEAMCSAALGDDGHGDDPTVKELEEMAAARMGKAAALFVPSGVMANLLAVKVFAQPADRVVCEQRCHLYAASTLGVAGVHSVDLRGNKYGEMDLQELAVALKPRPTSRPAALLCLENSFNGAGGTALEPEYIADAAAVAHDLGASVHLDGARIFNAAVALGVDPEAFTPHVDTVMFCLSKGLSSPVGSLLCGSRDVIARARHLRSLCGGTMRQVGILAACGIVSLNTMVDRLAEDHANARLIAEGLAQLNGIAIDLDLVQTNLIKFDIAGTGLTAVEFVARLENRGVKVIAFGPSTIRIATHKDVSRADAVTALEAIKHMLDF